MKESLCLDEFSSDLGLPLLSSLLLMLKVDEMLKIKLEINCRMRIIFSSWKLTIFVVGCTLYTQILCSYHVTGLQIVPIRSLLQEPIKSHLAKVKEQNEIHDFLAELCILILKFAWEPKVGVAKVVCFGK